MDKEEARARRRARDKIWREANPEKLKDLREKQNAWRRAKLARIRATPEFIEEKARREQERRDKIGLAMKERFADKEKAKQKTPKQRMSPERYEKYLEYMREKNRKRRAEINAKITDKEREDKRRRHREKITKALRERGRKIRLAREEQERLNPKPKIERAAPVKKPAATQEVKKPGRIVALCGWSRY